MHLPEARGGDAAGPAHQHPQRGAGQYGSGEQWAPPDEQGHIPILVWSLDLNLRILKVKKSLKSQ